MIVLSYLIELLKSMLFFTGSYSNNVFPNPLSKEEEEECIRKMILEHDMDARARLIEHNLRLVAHIVKKFENKFTDTDDLISIGTIGLIKGIDSYSLDKQTRITTYAARCIENEVLMYFRANKKREGDVSLNDPIGYDKDGNKITLVDVLKDDSKDIAEEVNLKDNISLLLKYLNVLNEREKTIIIKRYGLFEFKEMTQKDIAKQMNISRSYVSRIEKRAITKILKEFIKDKREL